MSNNRTCSFCGQHQDEVGRLIAGPRALICDRCVKSCAENFSGGSSWAEATRTWVEHAPRSPWPRERQSHFGDDVTCSFCGRAEADLEWLVGSRDPSTFVCDECVGICLTILHDPPTAPTSKPRVAKGRSLPRFRWPWQAPHVDKALRL